MENHGKTTKKGFKKGFKVVCFQYLFWAAAAMSGLPFVVSELRQHLHTLATVGHLVKRLEVLRKSSKILENQLEMGRKPAKKPRFSERF